MHQIISQCVDLINDLLLLLFSRLPLYYWISKYVVYFIIANADIYFDKSLFRLGDPQTLNLEGSVLSLLKWKDKNTQKTLAPNEMDKIQSESQDDNVDRAINFPNAITLQLRTDSQDAWIFQPPLNESVVIEVNQWLNTGPIQL